MNDYYPTGSERQYELAALRWNAILIALRLITDRIDPATDKCVVSEHEKPFDEACKSLVVKLNEPEKCWSCGQEKPA